MVDPCPASEPKLFGFSSERALAEAAAGGDRAARRALVMWLMPTVRNLAHYVARQGGDPEDLAQSALAEVLRNLPNFRAEGSLEGWARRASVRCMWASVRKGRARRKRDARFGADAPTVVALDPDREVDRVAARRRLAEHLQAIEPRKRMVLVLRLAEGLSIKEIAARVDAPVETVRTRLRVGKKELTARLGTDPALAGFYEERS
ncbi:MAG: RNA polymerase sigma factor [Myxococcota bacterium]